MEPDSVKGQPEGDPTGQGRGPGNPGDDIINQRGRRLESRSTGTSHRKQLLSQHTALSPSLLKMLPKKRLPIIHSEVQSL